MKAIPTMYRGNTFRSRLEARWAAFFDIIEWRWTYEPFDMDGYIPDFLIHGAEPLLVEIKPAVTTADYELPISKIESGIENHWKNDYLILGADVIAPLSSCHGPDMPPAGILGEYMGHWDENWGWSPDTGLWHQCNECWKLNVSHDSNSYNGRPCGHYDGGGNLGDVPLGRVGMENLWATAGSLVQWKSPNLATDPV